MGFEVNQVDDKTLKFEFKGNTMIIFPCTGWFTDKEIKDGRGIKNLIKQLK